MVNYIVENDLKILKTGFPDKWKYLTKKLAYPYEYFNSIEDYQKPVNNLKKEHFFSKLRNKCPDNEEIERTKDIFQKFNIKNGEGLTEIYLKSDVLLLACVFEKFIKISVNEYDIDPLYCVSLPGYTWQCGLKYTGINLQTLQNEDMILLLENNIRGGISSVMGDRYIKSNENKKILYKDANNLYGHSMSESLPYDEIKIDNNVELEDILNTPDDGGIGYFFEVDLMYPENIKEKTKHFPFVPENKKNFSDYMKEIKPDIYTQTKKLVCDWSDKKNYLVHYRMLKFYLRHGMIVDIIHNIISFRQSRWLEKYINFNTQKRNQAVNDFEKDFYKLLNNAFYGKTMENVRNRLKIKFIKKDDYREIIKQQSKLTFNGIHKSYENCDSYTFKQNEVLMDKPIYLGFTVLELSKLLMHETFYNKLQPYFGQENIQCHYMDSVTKDTPVLLKENENNKILRIDEIVNDEDWYVDNNSVTSWGYKEFADCNNIQIWTSNGRQNIKKLVRHKTEKDIYRVRTKHGIDNVTEDHSLINRNREIIKPCNLEIGEELLHNFMNFQEPQITFDEIINKIYSIEPEALREKEMFVKGFFVGDGGSEI